MSSILRVCQNTEFEELTVVAYIYICSMDKSLNVGFLTHPQILQLCSHFLITLLKINQM